MRLHKRLVEEWFFRVVMLGATGLVMGTLGLILATVFVKGFRALSPEMLFRTPQGGYYIGGGGGIANAIAGSLVLGVGATALALLVSLPLVFYLNVYLRRKSRLAFLVRFALDVLWGIPSIVYGAFGFTLMVAFGLRASLLAGTVTVALLIVPIMARSMDEVFKMVPPELAEASYAVGSTRWETSVKVVLRQAFPGLLAAVLIAFGRGIGDAASVLFTASFTDSLPYSLFKPVATLPLAIFFQLGTPFPEVQERGYASALVLTLIVLAVSILARWLTRRVTRHSR
jgi:phosphate transport system permease protein